MQGAEPEGPWMSQPDHDTEAYRYLSSRANTCAAGFTAVLQRQPPWKCSLDCKLNILSTLSMKLERFLNNWFQWRGSKQPHRIQPSPRSIKLHPDVCFTLHTKSYSSLLMAQPFCPSLCFPQCSVHVWEEKLRRAEVGSCNSFQPATFLDNVYLYFKIMITNLLWTGKWRMDCQCGAQGRPGPYCPPSDEAHEWY